LFLIIHFVFCWQFSRSWRWGTERWHCVHSECRCWPQTTQQSTVWTVWSAGRKFCLWYGMFNE